MEFSIKSGAPDKAKCDCIVVGVFEARKLTIPAQTLDKASGGHLAEILRSGDMEGKAGSTLLVRGTRNIAAERILLVGLGKEADYGEKAYRDALAATMRALKDTGCRNIAITLSELPIAKRNAAWRARQGALMVRDALYRPDQLKSRKDNAKSALAAIAFSVAGKDVRPASAGLSQGLAIAQGMDLTRELGNLPANICTPTYLAQQAQKLAREFKLKCEVLDRERMEKLGMGSLLAVGRGSHQPPRFVVLQYRGGRAKAKPIVLVGKGITFDTGGISLKPGAEMDEMKYDMSGAASVLGTLRAIAAMKLPLNVVGIVPAAENMPDGNAVRPGDVVTTLSGQTVEILDTDSEGRVVLSDALTYAERFNPAVVVDVATLTGAIVSPLGEVASGVFSPSDALVREVLAAGDQAWDRGWHMPLWREYQDTFKSSVADFANAGPHGDCAITAACFLSRFTKRYPWVHLDIAGTATRSGEEKGATGRPVALLAHFLLGRAAAAMAAGDRADDRS